MLEERQQNHSERRRFEKLQGEVFGVSLSQAREAARSALRSSSDTRDSQRREERAQSPAIAPAAPRIVFSETVQQPRTVQYSPDHTDEGSPVPQDAPAAFPTTDGKYVLDIVAGEVTWVLLTTVPSPECEGDTLVTYDVLALPPPV